jgi:phosphocarrier protein
MNAHVSSRVTVVNPLGLHARAAARFVELAGRYRSTIHVGRGGRRVDGKSILGLLLLAAPRGSVLEISATGEDADSALAALCLLVDRGFEDDQLSPEP